MRQVLSPRARLGMEPVFQTRTQRIPRLPNRAPGPVPPPGTRQRPTSPM